jgi:molecular chaperone HscB
MPNHFEILGIEPKYGLDLRDLEARYHERSRRYHPDRHARDDARSRVRNALATSELNVAYRILKDPVKRAEYLLKLHGIEVAEERNSRPVDPDFLMEIMELRESLAAARAERDEAKVGALAGDVRARRDRAMDQVVAGFAAGEQADLPAIAAALVSLRYYARFLDEIDAHDDARAQEELQ